MTSEQAKELKGLLGSLQKSVADLRKASQSNTDFIVDKLDTLLDKLDEFLGSFDV